MLTDIEGIPEIFNISEIDRSSDDYIFAREKLTDIINFVTSCCKQNGAEKIYFLDGHAGGGNVIDEKITSDAEKITIPQWEELAKQGKIDCVLEIGSHARAGTTGGFLDHTLNSSKIFEHKINGKAQSELSIHALFCGIFNIPTVLCCSDDAACEQAKQYIPDIITAPVKTAHKRNECKGYENPKEIIEKAVAKALCNYKSIKPLKADEKITVSTTFYRTDMCEDALEKAKFPCIRIDARTLERTLMKSEIYSYYQLVF